MIIHCGAARNDAYNVNDRLNPAVDPVITYSKARSLQKLSDHATLGESESQTAGMKESPHDPDSFPERGKLEKENA